jgi:hypothetical protein
LNQRPHCHRNESVIGAKRAGANLRNFQLPTLRHRAVLDKRMTAIDLGLHDKVISTPF